MKNQMLYDALQKAYGEVRVHNEGEDVALKHPIVDSAVSRRNGKRLGSGDVSGGEQYAVCCPFCGDEGFRLWVSSAMGAMIQVGDTYAEVSRGLSICYNENCLKDETNWHLFNESLEGQWRPGDVVMAVPQKTLMQAQASVAQRQIAMPPGLLLDDPAVPPYVHDYVESRGFTVGELVVKGLQVSQIPFYDAPVLIIPVYQERKLAMWQARYIGECNEYFPPKADRKKRRKPKYYIPTAAKKSWCLYNMDSVPPSKPVVLVEGVFDALKVGCAVCSFGSKISDIQLRTLYMTWGKSTLIRIPDMNDPKALPDALADVENWNSRQLFAGGAHVVRLPSEDPGYHTKENLWKWIEEQTGVRLK